MCFIIFFVFVKIFFNICVIRKCLYWVNFELNFGFVRFDASVIRHLNSVNVFIENNLDEKFNFGRLYLGIISFAERIIHIRSDLIRLNKRSMRVRANNALTLFVKLRTRALSKLLERTTFETNRANSTSKIY